MEKQFTADNEIVVQILAGNRQLYEELVLRYQQPLFSYLYRFLRQNQSDAEEVLQEVFIRSFEKLNLYDPTKSFKSWIFSIAHHYVINWIRSRTNKNEIASDAAESILMNISKEAEQTTKLELKDRLLLVQAAIDQLKDDYREVIVLHFYEDKSYQEISEILNKPTSSVGTLIRRAKENLKKMLPDEIKSEFDVYRV